MCGKKKLIKIFVALGIFFCFTNVLNAENVSESSKGNNFSFGSYALLQSRKSGGGLTVAIPIFSKGDFFIRDEFMASLYLANDYGTEGKLISLGDKLHFGCLRKSNGFAFRTYGYMKCEVGASADKNYKLFQSPLILELGGAGGFEFLFKSNQGFFVEFGGGATISSFGGSEGLRHADVADGNFSGGYVCLTTGFKHYF